MAPAMRPIGIIPAVFSILPAISISESLMIFPAVSLAFSFTLCSLPPFPVLPGKDAPGTTLFVSAPKYAPVERITVIRLLFTCFRQKRFFIINNNDPFLHVIKALSHSFVGRWTAFAAGLTRTV